MDGAQSEPAREQATRAQVDAVMLAAQALVGVTAQSVAEVEDIVTLPQLRLLVLVSGRGSLNLNALAEAMGVHPSNATRACDRLVAAGLLVRRESAVDRRNVELALTDKGRDLVESIVNRRRTAIGAVLARMPERRRQSLVAATRAFAQAAGEASTRSAWKLGWPE